MTEFVDQIPKKVTVKMHNNMELNFQRPMINDLFKVGLYSGLPDKRRTINGFADRYIPETINIKKISRKCSICFAREAQKFEVF